MDPIEIGGWIGEEEEEACSKSGARVLLLVFLRHLPSNLKQ